MKINELLPKFLPIALIFLVVLGFFLHLFYPIPRLFVTPDFGQSDLWQLNYPAKYVLSASLKNNSLPLWNKNIATGFPQLAEGQIGTFNLSNLILFRFLDFVTAINLTYVVIFLTAAVGTYFYLRFLNFNRLISFYSSIIFAFSGFFIVHVSHINLIQAASFLPVLFLLTHILIKKSNLKIMCLLALVLSQQFFSGFPQISFITLVGLFSLVSFNYLSAKKKSIYPFIFFTGAFFLFIFLSAIQILPSAEFLRISTRALGFDLTGATYYSYPLRHLLTLLNPFFLGNPSEGTYPIYIINDGSIFWENTTYMGIIPLLFVFISLFSIKKERNVLFYWMLLGLSLLFMMGKHSPLYFIYSFPPFNFFRVPSRFILLFAWSMIILASYGFQLFIEKAKILPGEKKRRLFIIIIIVISFINLLTFSYNYNPVGSAYHWLKKPPQYDFLNKAKERYFTLGASEAWNEIFLKKGWKSAEPYLYLRSSLQPNFNLIYDIAAFQVYPILQSKRFNLIYELINQGFSPTSKKINISPFSLKLFALNGIDKIISTQEIEGLKKISEIKPNQKELPSFKIYKTFALKRARMVYDYKKIETVDEAVQILQSSDFDGLKTAIVEKKIPFKRNLSDGQNSVNWVNDTDKYIALKVKTSSRGLLILSDSFYPGWQAWVDGKNREIYAANLNQRAVIIGQGTHNVEFVYWPDSFFKGALVSFITHLLIIFPLLFSFFTIFIRRFKDS